LERLQEARIHLAMTVLNTNHILTFSCIVSAAVVILGRTCSCLQFTYPNFNTSQKDDFSFSPGSSITNGSLYITPNTGNISHQSGRVVYARETLKLWNSKRTSLTSFRTEFVLNILPQNGSAGEGMAFILTNNPSLPTNSSGQWLGVFNNHTDGAFENRVVAVEFDTRKSYKDDLDGNHVGIDIDSIKSVDQSPLSNQSIILSSGSDVWVGIEYDGTPLLFQVTLIQYGTNGKQHVSGISRPMELHHNRKCWKRTWEEGAFGSYCLDYIFPLFVRCALHVEKADTAEKARLPQPGENDRCIWSSQI
jgi:interleukin-1 receptor-associated kinase 1